jgi:hypothetical protein
MTPKLLQPAANLQGSGFPSSRNRLLESQASKRTRPWQKVRLMVAWKSAWRVWVRSKLDSKTSCKARGWNSNAAPASVGSHQANEMASKPGPSNACGCWILCPVIIEVYYIMFLFWRSCLLMES